MFGTSDNSKCLSKYEMCTKGLILEVFMKLFLTLVHDEIIHPSLFHIGDDTVDKNNYNRGHFGHGLANKISIFTHFSYIYVFVDVRSPTLATVRRKQG